METFTFRVRVRDALDDDDANRLYEAVDEEISVETGARWPLGGLRASSELVP